MENLKALPAVKKITFHLKNMKDFLIHTVRPWTFINLFRFLDVYGLPKYINT